MLSQSLSTLPGTSPVTVGRLKSLEIHTWWDLLNHMPFRYENFSLITPIQSVQEGEVVTIKGVIREAKNTFTKRGLKIQKVVVTDTVADIEVVWYNQPYLLQLLKPGIGIAIAGEIKRFLHTYSIEPAAYEVLRAPDQPTIHTGRIVPVYPETKGLSSRTIREKIWRILNILEANPESLPPEWLPEDILKFNHLRDEWQAYKQIHFPDSKQAAAEARKRLAFDELFTIQLSAALIKKEWNAEKVSNPFDLGGKNKKLIDTFIEKLPFELTPDQTRSVDEILKDMSGTTPMNRFVQGDVGSGKTVVATIAAYASFLNKFQALIMAPTEILAQQHYKTLTSLLKDYPVRVGLQTGSKKMMKKGEQFDVIVGTQALVTKSIAFEKVGLVVIDEQHRFGVAQRAMLKQKGVNPHLLTMTATPIPRTVALTLYGELDLSEINSMPKGRIPIKTYLVQPEKRDKAYEWIKKQVHETQSQVFIICPLIEESEVETMKSIKAAAKEFEYLQKKVFKDLKLALLHGKMKPAEKEKVMQEFKDKKQHILVSTSVVEVGIDIPNATVMVIEGADRYGLAQLHQLRGRVGRGTKQSYCLLFTTENAEKNSLPRLEFFAKTGNGMELAEYDLRIRGPGTIYGTQQHGYMNLKVATLTNINLIREVKSAVGYFMSHYELDDKPAVKQRLEDYRALQVTRD